MLGSIKLVLGCVVVFGGWLIVRKKGSSEEKLINLTDLGSLFLDSSSVKKTDISLPSCGPSVSLTNNGVEVIYNFQELYKRRFETIQLLVPDRLIALLKYEAGVLISYSNFGLLDRPCMIDESEQSYTTIFLDRVRALVYGD